MKVQASLPNLRISPRKTRLVTRALVGASVETALLQLRKGAKKASSPIATLLESAVANAVNNHSLDRKDLIVDEIRVGDGQKLKRWLPRAFGRATPLVRRGSRVTIIVSSRVSEPDKVSQKKVVKKESPKAEKKAPKATPKKAIAKKTTVKKKAKVDKPENAQA